MNRFVAALAACLVLFTPALVIAQPAVQPYLKPPTGASLPQASDASGNAKTAEQFPREYQKSNSILYASTITASSAENVSAQVWTDASLYGMKWVRVRVSQHTIGGSGVNGPLIVRPKVSTDGGLTYTHMVNLSSNTVAGQDSLETDTLQLKIWTNATTALPNGVWYPLMGTGGQMLPFGAIQFAIINRGSATDSVTIEVAGRQF
jgi:hypothetical protein